MTTPPALPTMHRLHPRVQEAAWGSPSVIADLLGVDPDGGLHAELWMGDHHLAPSDVEVGSERVSLRAAVANDPRAWTGMPGHAGGLPFLLKVLAADRPLSIQVHPTREQAADGFAREDAAGIPVDAPHRSYRDTNHKPEMICALTTFEALCGFRAVDDSVALLRALGGPFAPWVEQLVRTGRGGGYRMVVADLLTLPRPEQTDLVSDLRARLPLVSADERWAAALQWVAQLAELHHDDAGVVVALLLEHVVLQPGAALFLPAGNMHAYLRGVAIEVMASSDNVLRGGLTRKHVDVAELVRVLDATPGDVPVIEGHTVRAGLVEWAAPTDEFHLFRVEPNDDTAPVPVPVVGPGIVLCTEGGLVLERSDDDRCALARGEAVFVRPGIPVRVRGTGTAFCATTRPTR